MRNDTGHPGLSRSPRAPHPSGGKAVRRPLRAVAGRVLLYAALVIAPGVVSPFGDEAMLAELKANYGERAYNRGVMLRKLLGNLREADTRIKLKEINSFFNEFTYRSDEALWGEHDYWATPVEFIGRHGGDCEDYVISKYFALRNLGIRDEQLFLTYAKAKKQNIAHMVLNYFETPESVPLVLDNYNPEILPVSERNDLIPLYSFNASSLFLSNPSAGLGQALPTDKIRNSKWDKLLEDIRRKQR